jgi:predicted porin
VRGSEALGGGLSAIFQIESSIQGDSSGGTLAGRETFVGLQGAWGTFKMGYFLAPYDDIHPIFGNVPTLTTSILSTANLWAQGSLNADNGGFDSRLGNSIRYDSPNMRGFTFSAQLARGRRVARGHRQHGGTDAQAKRHAYNMSLGGFYNNGPFQGGIAYEVHEKVRGAT